MSKSAPVLILAAALAAMPAPAQRAAQRVDTMKVLEAVEKRYNSTKTMRAEFTQTSRVQGRARAAEKGVVYISRPKKMLWDYSLPEGRQFLSDGKYTYDYDPDTKVFERTLIRETEDMRIPLAFLLGELDFGKHFDRYESNPEGENAVITAFPKNDNLAFTQIKMVIGPDASIREVTVLGQDFSETKFVLSSEQRNLRLDDAMFRFAPPPGAKVIEVGE